MRCQIKNEQYKLIIHIVGYGRQSVFVDTLEEASMLWQATRNDAQAGASMMRGECGSVYKGGEQVAQVSYNGRVWDTEGNVIMERAK